MDKFIDKLEIEGHVINQHFWHISETIWHPSVKINITPPNENNKICMEYIIIKMDSGDVLNNIGLRIQIDGKDLGDKRDRTHLTKMHPLQCENAYDTETNNLLKDMVRKNITNVFFIPIKITEDDIPFCLDKQKVYLDIFNSPKVHIDIYVKVYEKYTSNNTLMGFDLKTPFISELIPQFCAGNPGFGKKSVISISNNGEIISNFYIKIDTYRDKKRINNFYKVYDKITLEYGEHEVINIPIDYLQLYLKVIKGINLDDLVIDNCHVIPINLHELTNIPIIPLSSYFELRIYFHPAKIDSFHRIIQKNIIDYAESISDETNIILLPTEIWKHIASYLDLKDLLNFMQSCRFFYYIVPKKQISDLYEPHRITKLDIDDFDMELNVLYHKTDPRGISIPQIINKYRNIVQSKEIIDNTEYLFGTDFLQYPKIEWIIIEIDIPGQNDILDLEKTKFNFCKNRSYTSSNIDSIKKDSLFYKKMNDPSENRYIIDFYDNIHMCESINFVFKKHINTKINIYVSYYCMPKTLFY